MAGRPALRKSREANAQVYRDLQLSTGGFTFRLVKQAKTTELAKGDLRLAWTRLQEEYKPEDRT